MTTEATPRTLAGKTALVTGGSRNIGRETALVLAARGADVIVTYNENARAAKATVAEIEVMGARAVAVQANLTGTAALDELVSQIETTLGGWGRETLTSSSTTPAPCVSEPSSASPRTTSITCSRPTTRASSS